MLDNVGDFFAHDVAGEARLAARAEGDLARGDSEERVVPTHADVLARFYLRPALTDDDHTRTRGRAVGELDAEVFRIGIGKVFR